VGAWYGPVGCLAGRVRMDRGRCRLPVPVWQGTLDAFGVGFIVGGLVDLVAASLLNWMVNGVEALRRNCLRVIDIKLTADETRRKKAAAELLAMSDGQLYDSDRDDLLYIINEQCRPEIESAGELEDDEDYDYPCWP
jgi:hypothetical protein